MNVALKCVQFKLRHPSSIRHWTINIRIDVEDRQPRGLRPFEPHILDSLVLALLEPLIALLLTLALILSHKIGWTVFDEVALLAQAAPLGETVWDVHDALAVEHVAPERANVSIILTTDRDGIETGRQ